MLSIYIYKNFHTHFTKSIKMNAETVIKQATGSKLEIDDALNKIE